MRRIFSSLAVTLLATTATAQSAEEIALAKATLSQMQARSFAKNLEYCGYFAYDVNDNLVSTPATQGTRDSCQYDGPEDGYVMVLSWHTHAAFDEEFGSEVPSVSDIEADEAEGIDGFVATPGGRLWYVDTTDMIVRQICDLECLPQDPAFILGVEGVIEISYSYQELLDYEAE